MNLRNDPFWSSEMTPFGPPIIFTLIESAKRHGLEPHAYLCELLHRLPQSSNQEIKNLTPESMAKIRAKKKSAA
jgi:hypothetical protein